VPNLEILVIKHTQIKLDSAAVKTAVSIANAGNLAENYQSE